MKSKNNEEHVDVAPIESMEPASHLSRGYAWSVLNGEEGQG